MQIARSTSYLPLPLLQEPTRERVETAAAQPLQLQGTLSQQAVRSVEEQQQAQRLLNRQRPDTTNLSLAREGRQQRAVATYQSLQQSDQRAYVSEVLGIDVYA